MLIVNLFPLLRSNNIMRELMLKFVQRFILGYFSSICCLFCANAYALNNNIDLILSEPTITNILDLQGSLLIIPENQILTFNGGIIKNGTVLFNNTKIVNPCFLNCRFKGSVENYEFNIREYGAIPDSENDCSLLINDIIKLKTSPINRGNPKRIFIPKGVYHIDHPIDLFAGYEAPITLFGEGNMSTICQRHDNDYIIRVFEINHVRDLRLTYKNKQTLKNSRSIAIACQRSIFSIFENLTICKAHTAFGYITMYDQKNGYNPTGLFDQCYVSDNFRNIRIYETAGYAFDFKKEIPQGDSGSAYDNIYINNSGWLGNKNIDSTISAIRGDNTVATFTQLNIEGDNYSSSLIDLEGYSRVCIQSLHIEGLKNIPTIASLKLQSILHAEIIDLQFCQFLREKYYMFFTEGNAIIDVSGLCIRADCNIENNNGKRLRNETSTYSSINIQTIIDGTKTNWQ